MGNRQRKQRNLFYDSLFDTVRYNTFYRDRLTDIALSCVKWNNLPEEIDKRFLEWCLFYDGMAIFFKDDVLEKYVCIQVMPSGNFNMYRVPTDRTAYAVNGYQNTELNESNSVIIYNNLIRKPSASDIEIYAKKLTNIDLTINVNVNAQKTPVAIVCDETQKLTFENLYQQYAGNMPFVFGDKSLNLDNIKVLNTKADYKAEDLNKLKMDTWNEALTYLGVSNVQYQKKERINSEEINRSMGGAFASRRSRLKARQNAVDEINRLFNLDISVEFEDEVDKEQGLQYNEREGDDMIE
jgi:hypothetical protein